MFKRWARRAWQRLRFGKLREEIKAIDGGVPSEIEFTGRFGRTVGYWAYGYYDPNYPYRGLDV